LKRNNIISGPVQVRSR